MPSPLHESKEGLSNLNESEESQKPLLAAQMMPSPVNSQNILTSTSKDGRIKCDGRQEFDTTFKIIWHNLTYKVDTKRWYTRAKARLFNEDNNLSQASTCNVILNNVSGSMSSGQLTAILGPSGAGKSSLLNCLFQNRTKGVTGSIYVDGAKQTKKLKLCFIPQKDYLVEYLTIREDLIFVSKLRNTRIDIFNQTAHNRTDKDADLTDVGASSWLIEEAENEPALPNRPNQRRNVKTQMNKSNNHVIDHQRNALRVAELLGLTSCLDVKIGKISGGQQKRLSIAREIMSNPDVLILDEPTTGLDSLSCLKTIRVLKDLAEKPRSNAARMAIVVVIHQPQREVFELFNKVYFISKGGNVIFDDKPQKAAQIIGEVSGVQLPNANYNPASFLIEIASGEMGNEPINKLGTYQSKQFYSDYDIGRIKQLQKQRIRYNALSNWKFCTSTEDRKLSENESQINQFSASLSASKQGDSVTLDVSQNNNDQTAAVSEEQQISAALNTNNSSEDQSSSYDDNNSITNNSNSYFISYQLRNCLRSHPSNLIQSFRHVFILTHRSWLSVIRNPSFSTTRLAFHLILPLTMVFVFGSDMGSSNACPLAESELDILDIPEKIKGKLIGKQQEDARLTFENIAFFFVLLYGFAINIISITSTHYPLTLRMYKKETMNGLYTSGPYLIAQSLGELPLELFFPTISVLMAYPLTGQQTSYLEWRMFAICMIVTLVTYTNYSLGHLCGSIFVNNINVAVIVAQATTLPFVLLSGFVVRPSRMSYWLNKLTMTSPYKLGLDGILSARYGFQVCECNSTTFVDAKSVQIAGITTQMKHVMEYLIEKMQERNKESDSDNLIEGSSFNSNMTDTTSNSILNTQTIAISNGSNFFEKLGQRLLKAQTYGLELNSCADVKPYALHVYNIVDYDLFISTFGLIVMIIIIKMTTFSIVKSYSYFNKP